MSTTPRHHDYVTALYAVSRGFDSGPAQKAGLYFDDDKRGVVDKKWSSWKEHDPNTLFDVQWLGVNGHDMESLFADVAFRGEEGVQRRAQREGRQRRRTDRHWSNAKQVRGEGQPAPARTSRRPAPR